MRKEIGEGTAHLCRSSRAWDLLGDVYPQLTLWATNISSASPTGKTRAAGVDISSPRRQPWVNDGKTRAAGVDISSPRRQPWVNDSKLRSEPANAGDIIIAIVIYVAPPELRRILLTLTHSLRCGLRIYRRL